MKRTQSAFALLFAILVSFAAIFLLSTPINRWIVAHPDWAEWTATGTYALILMVFFSVNATLQGRQAKHQAEQETALLAFISPPFRLLDAAAGILIVIIILLLPAIRLRFLSMPRLAITLLALLAYWGLLRISRRRLRLVCTRHHILIMGFDARIRIPDPNGRFAYANPTGILAYNRIAGYRLSDTEATLYLLDENEAPIVIPVAGETAKQLEGILAMHRIQRWYPENA